MKQLQDLSKKQQDFSELAFYSQAKQQKSKNSQVRINNVRNNARITKVVINKKKQRPMKEQTLTVRI